MIIALLGCLSGLCPVLGQTHLKPFETQDTLYVSDVKTTHLLFGERIKYVDIGSPYFVADTLKQMLRLKHTGEGLPELKSQLSNLTVITGSGSYYSVHLGYDRFADQLNFNVGKTPERVAFYKNEEQEQQRVRQELTALCKALQEASPNVHIANKWGDDLFMVIRGIYYIDDKLGLKLELRNESPIDFEIDHILFRTKLNKRFTADYLYQERVVQPISNCGAYGTVSGQGSAILTFVFDKFSINKNERLALDVVEQNGGRSGTVDIPRRKLLQPKTIGHETAF